MNNIKELLNLGVPCFLGPPEASTTLCSHSLFILYLVYNGLHFTNDLHSIYGVYERISHKLVKASGNVLACFWVVLGSIFVCF